LIKYRYIIIITVALIVYSCVHKPDPPPKCVAGSGGSDMIVVFAKHGNTPIPNYFTHPDTAFIKFGTTISPGTNPENFDTFFVSEPGEDHIHCMGLKCGDYFIYRTAWDSVENIRRYGVYGISVSETSGEEIITVPVN
jgi:hypothetical protein